MPRDRPRASTTPRHEPEEKPDVPDTATILPPAVQPLADALAAIADLRRRLAGAGAKATDAAEGERQGTAEAEDALAAGQDAAGALAVAARFRDQAVSAGAECAGLRRAITKAEAALLAVAEDARAALHEFEQDVWNRLDARWKKSASPVRTLLAEATALAWLRPDGGALAHTLSKLKVPESLLDTTRAWQGTGVALGDTPPRPSDAALQVQAAQRLLAEAEAVAERAARREAA